MNLKTPIFHVYFFNMDISLIMAAFCLKMCIRIAEIYMEGIVSQNFDFSLVFVLWYIEQRILKKSTKNHKKIPSFLP